MNGDTRLNFLDSIKAKDSLDGDISAQIMYTLGDKRMINDTASVQTLNLQVTNSAGDTALLETELNYDDYNTYYTPSPALRNYVMYVKVGDNPDFRSMVSGIWSGGVVRAFSDTNFEASDVRIDIGKLNMNSPGVYPVLFRLAKSNADGTRDYYGLAKLLVIVEE